MKIKRKGDQENCSLAIASAAAFTLLEESPAVIFCVSSIGRQEGVCSLGGLLTILYLTVMLFTARLWLVVNTCIDTIDNYVVNEDKKRRNIRL